MKKLICGIISVILGIIIWLCSFHFASCEIINGKEICFGGAVLRNYWVFYWILSLIFIIIGIYSIKKK